MFSSSTLLQVSLSLMALSAVSATPVARDARVFSLPISGKINSAGFRTIADADRARASALRSQALSGHAKRNGNVPVMNTGVTYTAAVGVGSPPVDYTLIVDTGSSNTWVGADKPYVPTSSSHNTGDTVSVTYGSGSFSGKEYTDAVTLSSGLVIPQQSIGVASQSKGFGTGIDGILGVGPTDLTTGTVSNTETVPTVTDNLHSQGTISSETLGIYFEPTTEISVDLTGELTFGGVDKSKTTGKVNYVPITGTSPASAYWGIDQSISYGGSTILSSTAGIVDTGTTLVLIASDAFKQYVQATGATPDTNTGLLEISSHGFERLHSLFFNIGGKRHELTPNAQIWPRTLNSAIGGKLGSIYLIVADIGSPSGQGLDFINGYTFLERYYSVYDTSNRQVGFATTGSTFAHSN